MNDILSTKSSFADQATIFGRADTWRMCWLYTGTFGTFIGMSAGFPLLAKLVFPQVDAPRYAFLGPLIGALSRASSGWLADRLGGARVSFWVFVTQALAILGMIRHDEHHARADRHRFGERGRRRRLALDLACDRGRLRRHNPLPDLLTMTVCRSGD
jgi:nitrate/nitrite transporter NarK